MTLSTIARRMSALGFLLATISGPAVVRADTPSIQQWNQGVHDSCIPSAMRNGVTAPVAERYCSCVVRVLGELPVSTRLAMRPDSPLINEAATFCRGGNDVPPNLAGQSRAWDQATYGSCVPSAERNGASAPIAQNYCACTVRLFDELPARQKLAITPSSPEINAASDLCRPATQR
jgi:hypothetical protein